MIGTYPAE